MPTPIEMNFLSWGFFAGVAFMLLMIKVTGHQITKRPPSIHPEG